MRNTHVESTRAVVEWYLERYHGTAHDLGGPATFTDPARVGRFAVSRLAFERGDPAAMFRVLIAMTLFQRRQDQQVLRILRGMSAADMRSIATLSALNAQRARSTCPLLRSAADLHDRCDLTKTPGARLGICTVAPARSCHLKRHTILLKRYGHFGKVPTSAALMLAELRARSLPALRAQVFERTNDPGDRAGALEAALMRVWRVNRKISAMFLSAVCNPDLGPPAPPWPAGLDWTRFVVIDSNTDLFLSSLRYAGAGTYDARRTFIGSVAERIDLARLKRGLQSFNPRLVQQAMYVFMSRANRRASIADCHWKARCGSCPRTISTRCPVRPR